MFQGNVNPGLKQTYYGDAGAIVDVPTKRVGACHLNHVEGLIWGSLGGCSCMIQLILSVAVTIVIVKRCHKQTSFVRFKVPFEHI